MHVVDAIRLVEKAEQQGGGEVVGQIADQAQTPARVQRAELEIQGIGIVDSQLTELRAPAGQGFDQVSVQLYGVQPARGLQQAGSDGAAAGADFH